MLYSKIYDELHSMVFDCEKYITNSEDEFSSMLILRFQQNAFSLICDSNLNHSQKMELSDRVCEWVIMLSEYSKSFR